MPLTPPQPPAPTPQTPATPGNPDTPVPPETPVTPVSTIDPACSDCAAISATQYAGSGTGIWTFVNDTDQPYAVPVSLHGLSGQNVSLVFSNDSDKAQPLAVLARQPAQPRAARHAVPGAAASFADQVRAFNHTGWAEQVEALQRARAKLPQAAQDQTGEPEPPAGARLGDARQWYQNTAGDVRDTTLVRQVSTREGVAVNFWLEDGEQAEGKVTDAMLDTLSATYVQADGIYEFLREVGGPLWGRHVVPGLIAGTGQPVNVVLVRLQEYGLAGYFWALNTIRRTRLDPRTQFSNEAVVLFVDSSMMYTDASHGLSMTLVTLAHESMHMQNFYRRGVRLGPAYAMEQWLDEGTAVMAEDFISQRLMLEDNEIRDRQLPRYVSAPLYGCGVLRWPAYDEMCDGYAVWGAWGGYLNRQFGIPFYRNLLNDRTNRSSKAVLDAAIRSVRPGSGTVPELRRWAASVGSMMPAAGAPPGYGYPARTETGYGLPAIDLQTLVSERTLPEPDDVMSAYSMLPVVRSGVTGTFSEEVSVPPRTTLMVVVHDGKV
ncbi:M30 family zinc metallopeptidase [Cupriavidus agavae]|uniref:M30 family zinc metallopeptidase n=1 Tax=Cupriavidus agavae TaxID=1001822 RepID=UPI00102B7C57|nr:hemagglutinin [Cupriavidus agavae]